MNLTRGDTLKIKFAIQNTQGDKISKEDISTLFLTLKKSSYSKEYIFQKTLQDFEVDDNGMYCVIFEPKDTETLDYGEYVFDIEVTLQNRYRKTRIYKLELTEEATFHGGDVT